MENISADRLIRAKNYRYWENISHYSAVLMLLLLPIYFNASLYEGITEAKWHSFLFMSVFYISACILVFPFILKKEGYQELRFDAGRQCLSTSQIILLFYFGISCISALLSKYPAKDLIIGQSRYEALLSLFLYIAVFFCLSFWGEYSEDYFNIVAIVSIIIGVVAIPQLFDARIFYPEDLSYYNTEFLTTIGNIDCVSGVICCFLPILVCSYVLLEGKQRFLFTIGTFILTFVVIAINVDTSKIALLFALIIALPFLIDHRRKASRALHIYGVLVFACGISKIFTFTPDEDLNAAISMHFGIASIVCVLLGVIMFVAGIRLEKSCYKTVKTGKKSIVVEVDFNKEPKAIRRISFLSIGTLLFAVFVFLFVHDGESVLLHELHEVCHLRLSDDAGTYRGAVYKNCIKLIAENPLFGTGPGTFAETYAPYNSYINYDFAHCDLLQIAVCQGILAMISYIVFIVTISIKALKNAHKFYPIVIMGASMAGYLIYSFLNFSIAIVSPTFWIMVGILDKTIRQLPVEQ